MPARNRLKTYRENGCYHIYNRGVEKRVIFSDSEDYSVFLSYLKEYLSPKNEAELLKKITDPKTPPAEKDQLLRKLRLNNFADEITLLAYCLMPNHFHFLVKQKGSGGMDKFMNSLGARYTMYFNKKYKRVGPLYQGVYKAVLVASEAQLLELSRYIHRQVAGSYHLAGQDWIYSLPEYLNERRTAWLKSDEILALFSKVNPRLSYSSFISRNAGNEAIKRLIIEAE